MAENRQAFFSLSQYADPDIVQRYYALLNSVWFKCDTLTSQPGRLIGITLYTTGSGTYTTNTDATSLIVELIGGGGGGGGASGQTSKAAASQGGCAGSYVMARITTPAATYAYAVGAGNAGGAGNNDGSAGDDTTFGVSLTSKGGAGGAKSTAYNTPTFASNTFTFSGNAGGDIMTYGEVGGPGIILSASMAKPGTGGSTIYGAGGYKGTFSSSANGNPGQGYGSGGSGSVAINTNNSYTGGTGGGGLIVIREYA